MKKKLASILLFILFVLSFSGCTSISDYISNGITNFFSNIFSDVPVAPELTYGDFIYCYVKDAKSNTRTFKENAAGVNILTLTDEGEQKETIIIPESIDGLPVIAIGMGGLGWSEHLQRGFDKIYIPTTVQNYLPYSMLWHKTVFLVDKQNNELLEHRKQFFKTKLENCAYSKFFVFESMYSWYQEFVSIDESCSMAIANLTYIVEGEEYWMDNYEEGELITFPAPPQKEGFIFAGWYKDSDCLIQWNEETDTYSKPENLQTVKLYAKWIEQ